jgi:hypothetical protein
MGFIEVSDISGSMDDVVCFPDQWEEFSHLLFEDNTILLVGKRGDRGGIIIQKVKQL